MTTELHPIIIHTLNVRNRERLREQSKNERVRADLTKQIRQHRLLLDNAINDLIKEQKEGRDLQQEKTQRITGEEDYGPKEVVDALHAYAEMKITQLLEPDIITTSKAGIGVAGSYKGVDYVLHWMPKEG